MTVDKLPEPDTPCRNPDHWPDDVWQRWEAWFFARWDLTREEADMIMARYIRTDEDAMKRIRARRMNNCGCEEHRE
ncbi:hypothetical protein LCGC14_2100960 [marine sediment metagenome]|uniref:Uncharacterized protein n=1 Tax=marine sediment metagenome TaxID=412755 RepID=A0A0F9E9U4_9ZZZZ